MEMTFERYRQLVPIETSSFTKKVLMYLKEYEGNSICSHFRELPDDDHYSKACVLMLHVLSESSQYKEFLISQGFHDDYTEYRKIKDNYDFEELFAKYSEIFTIYDLEPSYVDLNPSALVLNYVQWVRDNTEHPYSWSDYFFRGDKGFDNFIKALEKKVQDEQHAYEDKTTKETFEGLSNNVISFLMCASSIYQRLIEGYSNKLEVNNPDEDFVPISLLLAVKYFNEFKEGKYDLTKRDIMLPLLQDKGITLEPGQHNTLLGFSNYNESSNYDIRIIKELFERYFTKGIYEGIEKSEVTVSGIVENVLRNQINDSNILDRVIPLQFRKTFDDFSETVEYEYRRGCAIEEEKYANSMCHDLRTSTRVYLETATKIYTLIKRKMLDGKHRFDLLNSDDDIDTLSLLLASFFMRIRDINISEFYRLHGITEKEIMDLIGIRITEEEIRECVLNRITMKDIFERFLFEGENKGTPIYSLGPGNVAYNLCNREFNKSTIMEDIFNNLAKDGTILEGDFLDCMRKELKLQSDNEQKVQVSQEQEDRMQKSITLFNNMDDETTRTLKRLAKLYQKLIKLPSYGYNVSKDRTIALLLTLIYTGRDDLVYKALESSGLSIKKYMDDSLFIEGSLRSYVLYNSENEPVEFDINILLAVFGDLIYDKNTGRKRNLVEMVKAIPEFCEPDVLKSIYDRQKVTSDVFIYIEEKVLEEEEKRKERKREERAEDIFQPFYSGYYSVFEEAIRTLDFLRINQFDRISQEELPDFSMLLSLLKSDYRTWFEENGLNHRKVCRAFGIDPSELDSFRENIKYHPHIEDFRKYHEGLENIKDGSVKIYLRRFFPQNTALDTVINCLNEQGQVPPINRDKLEVEVLNDKKYMDAISIDKKRELLEKQEVEELKWYDLNSIMTYGHALQDHSDSISDEFMRLEKECVGDSEVVSIQRLLARTLDVPTKPNDSAKEIAEKINKELASRAKRAKRFNSSDKLRISQESLDMLMAKIKEALETLADEIFVYNRLFGYVSVFRVKNLEYLKNAQGKKILLEAEQAVYAQKGDSELVYAKVEKMGVFLKHIQDTNTRLSNVNNQTKINVMNVLMEMSKRLSSINALRTAQDVLVPLVRNGKLYAANENDSLLIASSAMGLFNGLLARNATYAQENLSLMQEHILPDSQISYLEGEVKKQLQADQFSESVCESVSAAGSVVSAVPTIDFPQTNLTDPGEPGSIPRIMVAPDNKEQDDGPTDGGYGKRKLFSEKS